jgi:hypothetical protein
MGQPKSSHEQVFSGETAKAFFEIPECTGPAIPCPTPFELTLLITVLWLIKR